MTPTPATERRRGSWVWGPGRSEASRSWRFEILLFAAAYVAYNAARWIFVGDFAQAEAHAEWIMDLEREAGVAVEASVQGALDSAGSLFVFNHIYLAAQIIVLPGALIWLYRHSPAIYRGLRNTVIATWLIAIPIYALFPVAPPRLVDSGLVDTLELAGASINGDSTLFYNPLAAVPSLHVGFALAIGIAVSLALSNRGAKGLALTWGPAIALATVVTGNHYVFDVAAGALVTAAGFVAGGLPARLSGRDGMHRFPVRFSRSVARAHAPRAGQS